MFSDLDLIARRHDYGAIRRYRPIQTRRPSGHSGHRGRALLLLLSALLIAAWL